MQTDVEKLAAALRGCRDMLRECAKSFRSMGLKEGDPVLADMHARQADEALATIGAR